MKYLIHACPKRMYYVERYLVPSMIEQGINSDDIIVYNDTDKKGCLPAYIDSARLISDGFTWHLQDDVILSSSFKERAERFSDDGVVCGFCSYYSGWMYPGYQCVHDMWYSMPCIGIPDSIFKAYISWVTSERVQNKYRAYISQKKFVDMLFKMFMEECYKDAVVYNMQPNLVDNVDYLIGGSVINQRDELPNSLYFYETELVTALKDSLQKDIDKQK